MGSAAITLVLSIALVSGADAHPLAPALLDLRETAAGRFDVTWRTSAMRLPGADVEPRLPVGCSALGPATIAEATETVVARWKVECGRDGLIGQRVSVAGLGAGKIDALVRISFADGRTVRHVLTPRASSILVPERPRRRDVVESYAALGIEHILSGLDHLLFVFGLLLLVPTARLLVQTITAFTVGHSVTLSLATLGIANVAAGPMEVLIAVSVLLLARELARDRVGTGLLQRRPWLMALAFGLVHGLGFAGALREAGLPDGDIPLALLSFNVGIELGQIAFVFVVIGLAAALRRVAMAPPAVARPISAYAMGFVAAFWCLERIVAVMQ